ncbi:MAG: phosphate butyryltransferase [Anaerolineae bacterium]|nr:phosphate butyryltransferase [Anaerolineae bacterium]
MPALRSFADLLDAARRPPTLSIAIAGGEETEVLEAAAACCSLGLARPILVGDERRIGALAREGDVDLSGCQVVHRTGPDEVARATMHLVRTGQAQVAVKGFVSSTVFLHAALDREAGLRTERLVSHVGVFQIPGFPRLLCISDGGVVLYPDVNQKVEIIRNAIEVGRKLGLEQPRVALLAGTNTASLDRPVTREIAGLVAMRELWESLGAIVDGPFTLDVAIDPEAATAAGKEGEVAGRAEILIGPTLEATNTMCKGITYFAGGQMAGLVVGTRAPLALGSRSDPAETRLACVAIGVLFAKGEGIAS